MIKKLKDIANKLLNSSLEEEKKERLEIILGILEDNKCFFNMDIDTAFNLLNDLNFSKEESILIYKELIDSKNFKEVL